MTLGRTSSGNIKIKTDEAGGGLRAVECACCDFQPCRDCPPYFGDLNFSLTGDQVNGLTEFQYEAVVQYDPPRTCSDGWDAFSGTNYFENKLFMINLQRAFGGFFGAPSGTPCCWVLDLSVSGNFIYNFDFNGETFQDICIVNSGSQRIILNNNPSGSYNFIISSQCLPGNEESRRDFNFTVTVS